MEGDAWRVSHWFATRLIVHGQAFDSVVGDASSADATGLQVPAAAEVGLGVEGIWNEQFQVDGRCVMVQSYIFGW